jgi:hypothetical protein
MFNTNAVSDILKSVKLENRISVASLFENGSMFGLRIDEQSKQATFFYVRKKRVHKATLTLDKKTIEALKYTMRTRHMTHMGQHFVACGDVYLRPDMVQGLKPTDNYKPDWVNWREHKNSFMADITFVLRKSKAEITIRGIHNGVTVPFNNVGYHVIPRTSGRRYFILKPAKEGEQPLLQLDPKLPARDRGRHVITTGSPSAGNLTHVPREFMPI